MYVYVFSAAFYIKCTFIMESACMFADHMNIYYVGILVIETGSEGM